MAASVPVAASISQAWDEWETHQQSQRINKFFFEFGQRLQSVEQRVKSCEEYIRTSGETSAIIERAAEASRRTQKPHKRGILVNLATNALLTAGLLSLDEKLNAIDSLNALTSYDLNLLLRFSRGNTLRVDDLWDSNQGFLSKDYQEKLSAIIASISRLEARGLISETAMPGSMDGFAWTGDRNKWTNRWREKYYEILPTGQVFLGLISQPQSEQDDDEGR